MSPSPLPYADGPRLLADVGAHNIHCALEYTPQLFAAPSVQACADFPDLETALRTYLSQQGGPTVRHAALSLPNPIVGDQIKLTNHPWSFSVEAMRRSLGLQTLLVVNDYTALAMGLTRLAPQERVKIGPGEAVPGGVIGVLGPGSGLGVSGLVPFQDRNVALTTEGGHASYAPQDETEACIVALAQQRFGHVSGERLISAAGLELAYEALATRAGLGQSVLNAPEISRRAQRPALERDRCDEVACQALSAFCAMLGNVAGNVALTLGATGGVYIGGGIVPQILPFFTTSGFRAAFEAKGRFQAWLSRVPTWVLTAQHSALRGVSAMLDDHLTADHGAEPLLVEVRSTMERLSAAERSVAQDLLSAPRAWMSDPIARIAERCGVSTPTVMRFCRSLGFKGLADFKLRLGAGLSGTTKVAFRQVTAQDPPAERLGKVFDNALSALIALRDRLHPDVMERAIEALDHAQRIEIHASGLSAQAAEEAQHKLGRLGLMAIARTDPLQQKLTALHLGPRDVLLVISNSGAFESLNTAVACARQAGAHVIAMGPQRSELSRLADMVLPVDHPDDVQTLVPMLSRLMQSVVLDALVSGVALRRQAQIDAVLAQHEDLHFDAHISHGR